ncbi:MAG: alcohol dehydrogenase catalytic domain-containing protein [Caldilineaceae bacterium]
MPNTMKLLQILAPGQVEWRDAPIPQPGAGEVLVKVAAVTTCPHWALHLMSGEPMFPGVPPPYPYTPGQPGHEMTGAVVALGPGVTAFALDDRVAAWRDAGAKRQGCIEFLLEQTSTTVAIFGVLRENVAFGWHQWRRGLKLIGYERHNRAAAEQALALISQRQLRLTPLATHTLPLTCYAEGVALLRTKQAIKIRFLPWDED